MSITVIVTGANGYIAQHVVKELINKGYKVVGTVRTADKGDQLKRSLKSDNFTYEIATNIDKEGAFDEALKKHPEATVFLHTASPVSFSANDPEKDTLIPALNGTKNALSAIVKYGSQIKRVVVTSSIVAIYNLNDIDNETTYTEKDWNPITWEQAKSNGFDAYKGSKTFAEKAAWDFVKNEKPNFVLSTVNPAFVFGPQAFDESAKGTLNLSAEAIGSLLKLNPESEIPTFASHFIDVRDVAMAHLVAFEKDDAKNERLFLSSNKFTMQVALDIVRKNFPELRQQLPIGEAGQDLNKFVTTTVDNSKTRSILGFELIDLEKSATDTVAQVLKVNGKI